MRVIEELVESPDRRRGNVKRLQEAEPEKQSLQSESKH
jgi:hypothetical protein